MTAIIRSTDKNTNITQAEALHSHEIAMQLRELYHLSPINSNEKPEIIRELAGIMKDYADEESPVDAVKHSREDLY